MNAFPVIFARGRDEARMTVIRQSFSTRQASPFLPAYSPREEWHATTPTKTVRLRRPGTPRNLSCPKATELVFRTDNLKVASRSPKFPIKLKKPTRKLFRAGGELPIILGREIVPKTHKHIGDSPSTNNNDTIINLETEPAQPERKQKIDKDTIKRSKSVEGKKRKEVQSHRENKKEPVYKRGRCTGGSYSETPTSKLLPDVLEGNAVLPLRFSLMNEYCRVFGPPVRSSEKRAVLLTHITASLNITISPDHSVRISQHPDTREVAVLITGEPGPISRCCRAAVVVVYSKESSGKVLCTSSYCPSRTIANFHISAELRDQIWPQFDRPMEQKPMSPAEVSTHVRKGSYKVVSLRRERGCSDVGVRKDTKGIFTNEKLKHVAQNQRKMLEGPEALTPPWLRGVTQASDSPSIFTRYNKGQLMEQLAAMLQPG